MALSGRTTVVPKDRTVAPKSAIKDKTSKGPVPKVSASKRVYACSVECGLAGSQHDKSSSVTLETREATKYASEVQATVFVKSWLRVPTFSIAQDQSDSVS